MKRVTGIGGIFFKCKDPEAVKEWYSKHLGIESDKYGAVFKWQQEEGASPGYTVWNPFKQTTGYFNPSDKDFMINYRVENLKQLIQTLKDEGVRVIGEIEEFDYGKFGWIMDPEGNKIELWEPVDEEFGKIL
jgi:predicted enzyme related to lactoylglutathione lyase